MSSYRNPLAVTLSLEQERPRLTVSLPIVRESGANFDPRLLTPAAGIT